jgi:hypothetical protein
MIGDRDLEDKTHDEKKVVQNQVPQGVDLVDLLRGDHRRNLAVVVFVRAIVSIFEFLPVDLDHYMSSIPSVFLFIPRGFISFGAIGIFGTVERRRPGVQPWSTAFNNRFCAIAFWKLVAFAFTPPGVETRTLSPGKFSSVTGIAPYPPIQ